MSEAQDFEEIFEVEDENYFRTPNVYVDHFIIYLTSDEYKLLSFMVRNISGRGNFKHHSLAISVIARGRQLDKTFCVGIGMKEATVRKALQSLVDFGFIEPIGKPTSIGQNWRIGKKIKLGELRKRYQEKLDRDIARIQTARSRIGKKDDPSCPTEPLLSDRRGGVLSDRTSDVLSDRTHRNKEEKQKKEKLPLPAAVASSAGTLESSETIVLSHSHTPAQSLQPAQSEHSSLKQSVAHKNATTPQHPPIAAAPPSSPLPAEPPVRKESEAQRAQRERIETLCQAAANARNVLSKKSKLMIVPPIKNYANFNKVLNELSDHGITPPMYADYIAWIESTMRFGEAWDITLNTLAGKERPSIYMAEFRAGKRQISTQGDGQVHSTHPPAKNVYNPRLDPAYAHRYKDKEKKAQ